MDDKKQTSITLKSTSAVGISSRMHGANIHGLAFNIDFIVSRDPNFAVDIIRMFDKARGMSPDDPAHPEEDFAKALEDLNLPKPSEDDKI